MFMPGAKASKAYKFARPFYGPYCVVAVDDTGVEVRPVDRPGCDSIRVAFQRVHHCPEQIPGVYWPEARHGRKAGKGRGVRRPEDRTTTSVQGTAAAAGAEDPPTGNPPSNADGKLSTEEPTSVWHGRLQVRE